MVKVTSSVLSDVVSKYVVSFVTHPAKVIDGIDAAAHSSTFLCLCTHSLSLLLACAIYNCYLFSVGIYFISEFISVRRCLE